MRIKKDPATKNEYVLADGIWVRNFKKECVTPLNLSPLVPKEEISFLINNEESNGVFQIANISDENIRFRNAVIVSDGYDFQNRHKIIAQLPPDIAVIAVNYALVKWGLMGKERRPINLYVANNPYKECLSFLPKNNYFPTCVASSRTNPEFIKKYQGRLYFYDPTPSKLFGVERKPIYFIDDYRNPICAAIGLAYRFGVKKLMLMNCDDSFEDKRESSLRLENGLYTYPHHLKSQKIIDSLFFWYRKDDENIEISDYSSGAKYANALSLKSPEEVFSFFSEETI